MSGATKAGIGGLAGVIIACLMAWLSGGDVFQAFQQAGGLEAITNKNVTTSEQQDREFTEEEQQLVSLYRGLSAGNRRALRLLAGSLKDAQLGDACPDITVLRFMEKGLAAGTGDPSEFEERGRPIYLYSSPLISRADYVFPVSGDSMEPEYRDGDLVLVQAVPEGPELQYGETGAFIKGNEQFIKVYEEKGLRSLNPNYPFMNFSDTDETVCLIGRVIGTVDRERDLADDGDAEKYLRIHDGL